MKLMEISTAMALTPTENTYKTLKLLHKTLRVLKTREETHLYLTINKLNLS